MKTAGAENLLRLKRALRRDAVAMDALFKLGLHGGTIDALHLGQKQPYVSRQDGREISKAVAYPLLSRDGRPLGRYGYVNLPGITQNPVHPKGWAKGLNTEYRIGSHEAATAIVCPDLLDAWLVWQCYHRHADPPVIMSRTQWQGWPKEWESSAHWSCFDQVIVIDGDGGEDFFNQVAPGLAHPLKRFRSPPPFTRFAEMVLADRSSSRALEIA